MSKTKHFITKANLVHNHKYKYSKTNYVKSKCKVVITCPKHGDFQQIPNAHLMGQGCFECGSIKRHKSKKTNHQDAIDKCVKQHGDKYDYSNVVFEKVTDKIVITCPEHGVFKQRLINHYRGQGCPKCGKSSMGEKQTMTFSDFVKKAQMVHGDRYEYSDIGYENYRSKVTITCDKHGPFLQSAENHYSSGAGCPSCAVRTSRGELEIKQLIECLGFKCITSDREIIKPLELDIVIPELKIAIEYNGLIWHSEYYGKDKLYHYNKTRMCNENGYRLIHIWEDEWNDSKELQVDFISHQLGLSNSKKVYSRKCNVTNVDKDRVNDFLNKHHIQGSVVFSESICLTYKDELVSVSCFTRRGDSYELVRHCTSKIVVGSLGKATKEFTRRFKCEVYTFLDKSRFSGRSYERAGFILESEIPPDYSYVYGLRKHHKFNFRRDQIAKKLPDFYDDNLTEKEMMKNAGYHRLWDCGKKRYVFKG